MKLIPLAFALAFLSSSISAQSSYELSPAAKQRIANYLKNRKLNKTHDIAIGAVIDTSYLLDELNRIKEIADRGPRIANPAGSNYQNRRINRQFGESAAGGGSTSLVSLAGIADLFSAALENGALARDNQGTITTFRVNAYGLSKLFPGKERHCSIVNPVCDTQGEFHLRGLSGTVSIDNSKPQEVQPVATKSATGTTTTPLGVLGQGGRIAGAGFRYDFLHRVVPNESTELTNWMAALDKTKAQSKALSIAITTAAEKLDLAALTKFENAVSDGFKAEFDKPDPSNQQQRLEDQYKNALKTFAPSVQLDSLGELAKDSKAFENALDKYLAPLLLKPGGSIEYNHSQPANQTPISNIRALGDLKLWKVKRTSIKEADDYNVLLTFNGAVEFFEHRPAGLDGGRLRDIQAGAQADFKVGPASWQTRPLVSVAGYYQYQKENAILEFGKNAQTPIVAIPLAKPAVEVLNTKGNIGIVQFKLTIPVSKVITWPMSVTWSNRTELIKAPEVRGQFGIALNLDKLFDSKP